MMTAPFLAWYTGGVLALAALASLFIDYTPEAAPFFWRLPTRLAGAAILSIALGFVLARLPQRHWANQSWAVRCLLFVAAAVVSTLVALAVAG